jgi:hypothetical protein
MTRFSFGQKFYPTGLKTEIAITFLPIYLVCNEHGVNPIVSSGIDRKHRAKSLHYPGMAVDIYWLGFELDGQELKDLVRDDLADALGPHYDVVHSEGCIHIEYQPKVAVNEHWRT